MANRATRRRDRSRVVVVSGLTLAAMLAATGPIPAKVHATGLYQWNRHDDVDMDRRGGWYSSIASSADGSRLIAGVEDGGSGEEGPLYVSDDYGTTWEDISETVASEIQHDWVSVDMSNNGQVMVAASDYAYSLIADEEYGGRVMVSENGGDTWADVTPHDEGDGIINYWRHVVVSGDGGTLVALSDSDYEHVYVSEDGGDNWTPRLVDEDWGMDEWFSLAISDDGTKILFGGESWESGNGEAYLSEDSGATWDNVTPPTGFWEDNIEVVMNASGTKFGAAASGWDGEDSVFVSTNSGTDWTEVTPEFSDDEDMFWNAMAMSDDGSKIAVGDSNSTGNLFFSEDDGLNWTEEIPGAAFEDEVIFWTSFDFNSDGSRFVGAGGEEVYTGPAVASEEQVVDFGNAEDGKTVVLTLPSGTTVTCQTAVKESGLSAQDAGYQYPVGLVDFCFSTEDESNEISLVFVTDLLPNQVLARKYNPTTEQYATVDGVSITQTTYNSQAALRVTYTIVDNGPLDLDPDVGEIADPVGIASTLGAPNTGIAKVLNFLSRK